MRALSSNMTNFSQFLSTPKLVSDLLFMSDLLKTVEKDERNYYLRELIKEVNKNLPANVYIPIQSQSLKLKSKYDKNDRKRKRQHKSGLKSHRVLSISQDYAFCLHSKERVPYHIIIKVAHEETPKTRTRSDSLTSPTKSSYEEGDSSSSSSENLVASNHSHQTNSDMDKSAESMKNSKIIEMVEIGSRSCSATSTELLGTPP